MEQYKQEFIEFMVDSEVLKFGEFTLKIGRSSHGTAEILPFSDFIVLYHIEFDPKRQRKSHRTFLKYFLTFSFSKLSV